MVSQNPFHALPLPIMDSLRRASTKALFSNNDVIYIQEDVASHFYFIQSGYVRLSHLMEDGSAVLFGILPSGDVFGELGVFDHGLHCDTATAIGDVALTCLSTHTFHDLAKKYPELPEALSRLIAQRYRSYIELTRNLSLKSLTARLAQSLLRLGETLAEQKSFKGRPCAWISPIVTQSDLGVMARGSRGNVNRLLKSWRDEGWIAIQDRSIVLLSPHALASLTLQ